MAKQVGDESVLFDRLEAPKARELALAGVECFAEHGFFGTTTRDIANRVGLSPAAVYVHFPSKADLLYTISTVGHESALQALEEARASEKDPVERIAVMVARFASWHARNHRVAKVIQYELHALSKKQRNAIYAIRQKFPERIEAALEEGAKSRSLTIPDPGGATLAILSLCIDVARWYTPSAPRSPGDLGALYGDLIMRMLGFAQR